MLVRDFIEDSLYNPQYGYFPRQANIFNSIHPVDFRTLRNSTEFQQEVAKRYYELEGQQKSAEAPGPGLQIWHTPTEMFKVCLLRVRSVRIRVKA